MEGRERNKKTEGDELIREAREEHKERTDRRRDGGRQGEDRGKMQVGKWQRKMPRKMRKGRVSAKFWSYFANREAVTKSTERDWWMKQREKHSIVSSHCGASNIWRPASQTSDNAAGSLSRSLPVRGAVHMRSLRHYSYIMGCLNHWRCSTLINYLTAYIWLLTHLVNGLQQSMSDPIPQLERFTNYLAWDTCNIIT